MFRLRDKGACFNDPGDSKPGFLSSFLPKAIKVCMYIHEYMTDTERNVQFLHWHQCFKIGRKFWSLFERRGINSCSSVFEYR